jgi:hypothetical protein
MNRLRLYDLRLSRLPAAVGLCAADMTGVARYVNSAEMRMLYAFEAGEESWWGTWTEVAFNVDRTSPFITLPRRMARLEQVTVCRRPVYVQNQFFEYLRFGNGRLPKIFANQAQRFRLQGVSVLSRNDVVSFADLINPPKIIRVYATDSVDAANGSRILIQGTDNNDNVVYSQDGFNEVQGMYLTLDPLFPFVQTPIQWNTITGISKDITAGAVQIFQVDPTTGDQSLILTMEPTEQTGWYRRYYLDSLPLNCCPGVITANTSTTVQVTAIAKVEPIPVLTDTDYTVIQNVEAFIEESQAVRYSEMDTPTSKQLEAAKHRACIRLLNGELTHYVGKNEPAVNFAPFGSAKLVRQQIGTML